VDAFYLSAADVRELQGMLARQRGGRTSERPIARRRRSPMNEGGGSTLREGECTQAFTARAADWSVVPVDGLVQPKKDDAGGGMVDDGPPIALKNILPFPIEVGATVIYDPDSLKIREATCPAVEG
jgi:hypothetical protein